MHKFRAALILGACLAFAPAAFAIPFSIEIKSSELAAGGGVWSLSGPTSASDSWEVGFGDTYNGSAEIAAGSYTWNISGLGVGLGTISWTLYLYGQQIYSGHDSGLLAFIVGDSFTVGGVAARPTAVSEPGTLVLLGAGLLAMAVSLRRKRSLA
jgi:hypothetical protein